MLAALRLLGPVARVVERIYPQSLRREDYTLDHGEVVAQTAGEPHDLGQILEHVIPHEGKLLPQDLDLKTILVRTRLQRR